MHFQFSPEQGERHDPPADGSPFGLFHMQVKEEKIEMHPDNPTRDLLPVVGSFTRREC